MTCLHRHFTSLLRIGVKDLVQTALIIGFFIINSGCTVAQTLVHVLCRHVGLIVTSFIVSGTTEIETNSNINKRSSNNN